MLRLLRRELQARSPPFPFPSSPFLRLLSSSSSSSSSADAAAVFGALRSHGVPDDLSRSIVAKFPRLLSRRRDETLCPKLAFLRSEGFSSAEVAGVLLRNPYLLSWGSDRLAASVGLLKSILPSKDALLRVLKRTNKPFTAALHANIAVLQAHGLPEAVAVKLLYFQPRSLTCTPADFTRALEYLRKLDMNPAGSGSTFAVAVGMLSYMSMPTFRRKIELYMEFGWTEAQVLAMFRQQPTTLGASDHAIRKKVRYYRDTVGWDPEFFCRYPAIMTMSMEKRIIPRCAVLNVLMSDGLLKRDPRAASKFALREEVFVENFVKKYEKTVPEVAMAYEGKIEFTGWDWLKDGRKQLDANRS